MKSVCSFPASVTAEKSYHMHFKKLILINVVSLFLKVLVKFNWVSKGDFNKCCQLILESTGKIQLGFHKTIV